MTSKLALAAQVAQDLGREFAATVFRTGPTGQRTVTCGLEESTLSLFHLRFNEDGECAGVDWVVIGMFTLIIHAVSWFPRPFYEFLANSRMKGFRTWDDAEAKRFSATATGLLFFCSSGFFAWRVLSPKDWIWDRYGWKEMAETEAVDPDFKCYYLIYAARFYSDLVSIFYENKPRDVLITAFIHHLVTLGLVFGSALTDQTGYGGIIMFIFDWGDIPLLAAKLFKYLSKDPKDMFQFIANRLFEIFALTFFLTRNVFYNYVVVSSIQDNQNLLNIHLREGKMAVLMVSLALLQTYWLGLLIKAVQRQRATGGNVEDVREKKEE